jgi:hypothetical protein
MPKRMADAIAMLRLCRIVHDEVTWVLYSNRFNLNMCESKLTTWLSFIGARNSRLVRRIDLRLETRYAHEVGTTHFTRASMAPNADFRVVPMPNRHFVHRVRSEPKPFDPCDTDIEDTNLPRTNAT